MDGNDDDDDNAGAADAAASTVKGNSAAVVSGRGARLRLAINLSFIILVLSLFLGLAWCCRSCRGATLRLHGGSRQADLQFLLPSFGHNLDLEEGLGPLVGLGFFSLVSYPFQGC